MAGLLTLTKAKKVYGLALEKRSKARSPTAEASVLRTVQVWVRIPPGLPSESSQVRSPPPVALFLSIKRVITLQREDFVRR